MASPPGALPSEGWGKAFWSPRSIGVELSSQLTSVCRSHFMASSFLHDGLIMVLKCSGHLSSICYFFTRGVLLSALKAYTHTTILA